MDTMNRMQTVRYVIKEITSIASQPSDDFLENEESREKPLDCSWEIDRYGREAGRCRSPNVLACKLRYYIAPSQRKEMQP